MRFIHSADWQLGFQRSYLDDEAQARFTQSRIDAVGTIAQIAAEREANFVVVAGDVFESNHVERRVVKRALEQLGRFDVPVLLLPGNHDPADAASVLSGDAFARHRPDSVHVLDDGPLRVCPGVEVVGVPWTSNLLLHDAVAARIATLDRPPAGVVRVLVAHGAVDRIGPDRHDPALIDTSVVEQACHEGLVHYLALGDRHSTTPIGDTGRIWYAGAPEPTRFTEINAGNCLSVDLTGAECRVEVVPVGRWRFHELERTLTHDDDVTALADWCEGVPDGARAIVRLRLSGVLSLRAMATLDAVLAQTKERLACLDLPEGGDLVAVADDEDLAGVATGPVTRAAVEELSEVVARGGPEAATAGGALRLLYGAAVQASPAPSPLVERAS